MNYALLIGQAVNLAGRLTRCSTMRAGRGHDSLELARLVGRDGTLIAMDIQVGEALPAALAGQPCPHAPCRWLCCVRPCGAH